MRCTIALAALQNVMDPEIGLSVVDLGLICQLYFDDVSAEVHVLMTLTTQFCPMGESIVDGVTQVLQSVFPGDKVNVALTFDPPWNHERISEEGQKLLNH